MTDPIETTTEAVTSVSQLEAGSEVSVSGASFLPESNLTVDNIGVDYGDYDGTVVEASLDRANSRSYSFLVTDDGFVKTTDSNGVFDKGVGMYVVAEVEPDTTVESSPDRDDYAVDVGDVARGDTVRVTYMSSRNGSKKAKVGVVTSIGYDYYNGDVRVFTFDTGKERNGEPVVYAVRNWATKPKLKSRGPKQTSRLGPIASIEVFNGDDRDFDVNSDRRDDSDPVFDDYDDADADDDSDEDETLEDAADVARDTAGTNTVKCYYCDDEVATDDVVTEREFYTEEETVDAGRVHRQTGERMNVKTRDVRKSYRVPACPECAGDDNTADARTDGGEDVDMCDNCGRYAAETFDHAPDCSRFEPIEDEPDVTDNPTLRAPDNPRMARPTADGAETVSDAKPMDSEGVASTVYAATEGDEATVWADGNATVFEGVVDDVAHYKSHGGTRVVTVDVGEHAGDKVVVTSRERYQADGKHPDVSTKVFDYVSGQERPASRFEINR